MSGGRYPENERSFAGLKYEHRFRSSKEMCEAYAAETREMGGQARVAPSGVGYGVWTRGPSPRLQGWIPRSGYPQKGTLARSTPKRPRLTR